MDSMYSPDKIRDTETDPMLGSNERNITRLDSMYGTGLSLNYAPTGTETRLDSIKEPSARSNGRVIEKWQHELPGYISSDVIMAICRPNDDLSKVPLDVLKCKVDKKLSQYVNEFTISTFIPPDLQKIALSGDMSVVIGKYMNDTMIRGIVRLNIPERSWTDGVTTIEIDSMYKDNTAPIDASAEIIHETVSDHYILSVTLKYVDFTGRSRLRFDPVIALSNG